MAIRWDKFTIKAQEAIQQANEITGQHGNPEMLPLHLLAALLQDSEGIQYQPRSGRLNTEH